MAEAEKGEVDTSSHVADWEVVSLTASAFAAAPGPKGFVQPDMPKDTEANRNEHTSSYATLLSGHFSDDVNLPIRPEYNEIYTEPRDKDVKPAVIEDDWPTKTIDDLWNIESVNALGETQLYEKKSSPSDQNIEYGEGKALHGLTLIEQEQVIYDAPEHGSFHAVSDVDDSALCDDTISVPEPIDPSHQNLYSHENYGSPSKSNEENRHVGSHIPSKAWWKKQADSLYTHVKEANSFWPVFVVAAVVGLVILGRRWQREKLQLQQFKLESSIDKERVNKMAGPICRLKYVLGSDHQQRPFIHGGPPSSQVGV